MSVKLGEVHRAEWIANGGNPQSEFLFWCDSKGRYADGHAFRTTIVSLLAQSGISPKELQGLARHSDPKTTLRDYAKLSDTDLERAVKCLPDLAPQKKTSEEQLNVGQAFAVPSAVPLLCQKDDVQRMNLILNDASGKTAEIKKISGKTGFLAEKKKRALPDSNRGITVLQTVTKSTSNHYKTSVFEHISNPAVSSAVPLIPDDLREVAEFWDQLTEPIRLGIVAMVRAARNSNLKDSTP